MTTKCFQLYEVAYQHEAPLTQPTTFEGAVASWRLITVWISGQANWELIEKQVGAANAYATYHTPERTLYGLWVKETTLTDDYSLPQISDKAWLARSVTLMNVIVAGNSEEVTDHDIDVDRTPTENLLVDELADTVESEVTYAYQI